MSRLMPPVVLYTRQHCHLCEVAHQQLKRHGLHPEIVDIDQYAELVKRYTECVPVVVIDGRERFRGRVNETLLKRELTAAPGGDRLLGMFAKFWQPGRVKTRLAASIGPAAAAGIYHQFVRTLASELGEAGDQRWLLFDPPPHRVDFETLAGDRWHVAVQSSGDLGQRMTHFFGQADTAGSRRTVLIGSDSPNVPATLINLAFKRLEHDQVVVGPTEDGGYYLLGIAGTAPAIFEHVAWSTPQVWQQTEQRLRDLDVRYSTLPIWYDIDQRQDLVRLGRELRSHETTSPALAQLSNAISDLGEH